jgi:tetratricopeptide (TPR) repeat protein
MTYPPLHELMTTENELVRAVNKYVTNTAPAAHRKAFMKPFMREDAAEFCATCHKVHLDKPVNNYRWFRGFNSYDDWQASGVSGQGARSFYYPPMSQTCNDCHMPLVASTYPGNKNGFVRSHNFAAANTAVPFVNGDEKQLKAATDFLTNDIVSVDIFAASPVVLNANVQQMRRRASDEFETATMFAAGEESGNPTAPVVIRNVGEISAPLDQTQPGLQAGSRVKVDVVVRTKKVGHFFPSGTVDSFDVWVEMKASDARGETIFWSGRVEDEGTGPVDPQAHFYRAFLLDAHGNPINKRNAFQARTALYARLIPPGAADTVHFEMAIPPDAAGPIRIEAKLNYRKFSHYYTQFSYAGKAGEGEFTKDFDDREFDFSPENIPENVSGKLKGEIPNLPIVVMATDEVEIPLGTGPTNWTPAVQEDDYIRWNDYGIGLLLQGDIRGAQYAFERVTEAKPDYADGWLNIARALLLEGRPGDARPFIDKAMDIDGSLARVHFFKAMADKREGLYDEALEALRFVESQYPKDRVALNEIARILFLRREYQNALSYLERVARIDPEDLQMHYTAMLCYRGLGDEENADREQALFERFKIDEKSQVIAGEIRRHNPEDNNERNPLHAHVSAMLP